MKTSKIVSVYKTMNDSKLTKMEDADKFKVIKALRAIKPISEGYEEFVKLTHEKLKDDKKEEGDKENELTYDKLSEDAFGKYIASNDFNVSTIMDLQEVLVGE